MALQLDGYIELPPNKGAGGFDHADVHVATDRLYVAHTGNDALDVIDCGSGTGPHTLDDLRRSA
jgi:hypothetical protein